MSIAPITSEIGRPGSALRGVAGDGKQLAFALAAAGKTTVSVAGGWHAELPGEGGPLARAGNLVIATSSSPMRGAPGSLVVALDAATGAERWRATIDATGWAVITAIAPTGDGDVVIAGSFAGTLRAGASVVSSAGQSDGFVARLSPVGSVAWLERMGGAGADGVQGVAAAGDRIAIAGTFVAGAELLGAELPSYDPRSVAGDAFVAELDGKGARRWVFTYGGKENDAVAGVAIDRDGRVVVAGTARESVHVSGTELVAQGASDGIVVWLSGDGSEQDAILIGGPEQDGISAITSTGSRTVVAGTFTGSLRLGDRTLDSRGSDDAFVAALDAHATVVASWQAAGEGREEITALSAVPGGFVAGVAHTARASFDGAALPAPADPAAGAALVVRGVP